MGRRRAPGRPPPQRPRAHLALRRRRPAGRGRVPRRQRDDATPTTPRGRLVVAGHPALGTVTVEHDAAGGSAAGADRARRAARPGATATARWSVTRSSGPTAPGGSPSLERDAAGRVVAATTDGVRRSYGYDAGGQLVAADRARRHDGVDLRRRGPAGGRGRSRRRGRLPLRRRPPADRAGRCRRRDDRFAYDAAGPPGGGAPARRAATAGLHVGLAGPAGRGRRHAGWPSTPSASWPRSTVARCCGTPSAPCPQLRWCDGTAVVGGAEPWATVGAAGAAAGSTRDWQGTVSGPDGAPGAVDPWGAGRRPGWRWRPASGSGSGASSRSTAWCGCGTGPTTRPPGRSCPPTRCPACPGTPYAAHPYHYAGNDPLGPLDPLGLRPLTDADLHGLPARRAGQPVRPRRRLGRRQLGVHRGRRADRRRRRADVHRRRAGRSGRR